MPDIRVRNLLLAGGICVNQEFDEARKEEWCTEKAEQVKVMCQIYKSAANVCIDRSCESEDLGLAFELMKDLEEAVEIVANGGLFALPRKFGPSEFGRYRLLPPADRCEYPGPPPAYRKFQPNALIEFTGKAKDGILSLLPFDESPSRDLPFLASEESDPSHLVGTIASVSKTPSFLRGDGLHGHHCQQPQRRSPS